MFDFLKNIFRAKQGNATVNSFMIPGGSQVVWTADDYEKLTKEGYNRNVYVYRAVDELAKGVASVPVDLFRKRGNELKEVEGPHPLKELLKKPNETQGGSKFTQAIISYLSLSGNTFIRSNSPTSGRNSGKPKELTALRPDRIKIVAGGKAKHVLGYEHRIPGKDAQFIPAEEMLHMKTFNPLDDFWGLSPVRVAARSIDQNNEAKVWNVALMQNRGVPHGGFKMSSNLTTIQRDSIRADIEKNVVGPENAGRPRILEGGMEWQSFGFNPAEMEWKDSQQLSAKEIAMIWGVPPEIIGDSTNKNYSNYQEARKALFSDTIMPLTKWYYGELNFWLVPSFDSNLILVPNFDDIPVLQEDQGKLWERVGKATWLTMNEQRRATGFEDIDGGDVILVGFNQIPLTATTDRGSEEKKLLALEKDKKKSSKDEDNEDEDKDKITDTEETAESDKMEERKELIWKTFDQSRFVFLDRTKEKIKDRLEEEKRDVRAAIKSGVKEEDLFGLVNGKLDEKKEKWIDLLVDIALSVGDVFAQQAFTRLKGSGIQNAYDNFNIKADERDAWLNAIRIYTRKETGDKVVNLINEVTKRTLRTHIEKGIIEGESIDQIAGRIDGLYLEQIIPNRSEVIARTEIIRASNKGSREGAKATGLPLGKQWLATRDDRTRGDNNDHFGLDPRGKETPPIPIDQLYVTPSGPFAGDKLMFPGDPEHGARAGNIIQCRCTEVYDVIGE